MGIVIVSRIDGRNRGGLRHPLGGRPYDSANFTLAQLRDIASDPTLVIVHGELITHDNLVDLLREAEEVQSPAAPETDDGGAAELAADSEAPDPDASSQETPAPEAPEPDVSSQETPAPEAPEPDVSSQETPAPEAPGQETSEPAPKKRGGRPSKSAEA